MGVAKETGSPPTVSEPVSGTPTQPPTPSQGPPQPASKPPGGIIGEEETIEQQQDGNWIAWCGEEDCAWRKVYPTRNGAILGVRRHRGDHKKAEEERQKAKAAAGGPPDISRGGPPDTSRMSPREIVAYYGPEGLEMLKRQRLSEFLSIAPGVGEKIAQWILKQWDTDQNIRKSANNLMNALTGSGLRQEMAYRIASMLYTMDDEYKDILDRQQQQVFIPGTGGPQQKGPTIFFPERSPQGPQAPQPQVVWNPYTGRYEYAVQAQAGPQPGQPQYVYPYPYPPEPRRRRRGEEGDEETLTKDEVAKLIREAIREDREQSRLDKVEQALVGVGNTVDQLEKRLESGEFGKRREEEESPVTKDLKDRLSRMEDRERQLTEDLHKAERAVDQKEAEHLRQELKDTRDQIGQLRTEISLGMGGKTVEGYKEDSMRVVGQGMQTMAQVAQTRKPAETIAGYIFGGPPGTPQQPPPEALGGLAGRLSPRFVTRVP